MIYTWDPDPSYGNELEDLRGDPLVDVCISIYLFFVINLVFIGNYSHDAWRMSGKL